MKTVITLSSMVLVVCLFVLSCNKQDAECTIHRSKENIYEINIPGATPLFVVKKNGGLSVVSEININDIQCIQELNIDSTGFLLSKLIYNDDGQLNDQQHYFYDNSINLQAIETYKNHRKSEVGLKFYKGGLPGRIEVVSNYSEEGYLFSRKFYDPRGNTLRIEDTDTGFGSDVVNIEKDSSGHLKQFDKEQ